MHRQGLRVILAIQNISRLKTVGIKLLTFLTESHHPKRGEAGEIVPIFQWLDQLAPTFLHPGHKAFLFPLQHLNLSAKDPHIPLYAS